MEQTQIPLRWFRHPHHQDLLDRAGVSGEIADGRPYHSLTDEVRVQLANRWSFAELQLEGGGLVVPRYKPTGEVAPPQIRHDELRRGQDGSSRKYDSPPASGGVLDVHPMSREKVLDASYPLWVPESVKGADALASKGHAAVGFQGCWGWSLNGSLAPDWELIPLEGREVFVCFDSDVCDPEKGGPASPRAALYKFTRLLRARGADVFVAVIPQPGDEKLGIDDHLGDPGVDRDGRDDKFNVPFREITTTGVGVTE